ncbi:TonB family protein [Paracraurococcus ruber]|nr:TonB family protein [Paracraurococcus ruber]
MTAWRAARPCIGLAALAWLAACAAPAPAAEAIPALAGISPPRPVSRPPPRYPVQALRSGAQGEVILRLRVGTAGRVEEVEVLCAGQDATLRLASEEAVRGWRFDPARDAAGEPVPADIRARFVFRSPAALALAGLPRAIRPVRTACT